MTVEQVPVKESPFIFPVRVYFEDTDAAGIVYHTNFLKYMERARTEMSRLLGANHSQSFNDGKTFFVIRHIDIEYHQPAHLDDWLEVRTFIKSVSKIRFEVCQQVLRDEVILAEAYVNLVNVNQDRKPAPIPLEFQHVLKRHVKENENGNNRAR